MIKVEMHFYRTSMCHAMFATANAITGETLEIQYKGKTLTTFWK